MSRTRVLVVDDSAFMRRVIKQMIESDPDLEVVGTARDGVEGVEMTQMYSPDVITMDVEMPRMNGLEALSAIMDKCPTPVIMISSLTNEGAKATFDALDRGAVDYIAKHLESSSFDIMKIQNDITGKVKAVAKKKGRFAGLRAAKKTAVPIPVRKTLATQKVALVAIGASTGGPRAVQEVLSHIPKEISTPFLVVIHMPGSFTGAFAERLNSLCSLSVKEAENGEAVKGAQVLISPGGRQTRIRRRGLVDFYIEVSDQPGDSLYKPCVDVSMTSVAESYPGRSMGVILTGMGHDGREGMKAIKSRGGKTLAQNEETCTVYGMPKAVVDAGLADKIAPLENIAAEIVNMI